MRFFKTANIDFISKRHISFALSAILLIASIAALVSRGGPNYGIDFTGGILMQVSFAQAVDLNDVRSALNEGQFSKFELQSSDKSVIIRIKKTDKSQEEVEAGILTPLQNKFTGNTITVDRTEYVGPSVGKHLSKQAFYAFIFAFIGIVIYVAFRFKSGLWGVMGVVGIVHDTFITFGILVILNKEVDLTLIAALLTVAGFSINDKIVLYDRIRENLKFIAKENFGSIINKSINSVLLRTIITSLTVFIVSVTLFLMGGEVIHNFALAMTIGTVLGVYSSIFICSPLIFEWEKRKRDRFKKSIGK